MSKRAREPDAAAVHELPNPKRAKLEEEVRTHEVAPVFILVPDVFAGIAAWLDPVSQRAFCCASRTSVALMGPHRHEFVLPMLKWVAAHPNESSGIGIEIKIHRRAVANRRRYIGTYYDHVAYCRFQMPFFAIHDIGIISQPTDWTFRVIEADAVECMRWLLNQFVPPLRDQIITRIRKCSHAPRIMDFAIRGRLVSLKDVITMHTTTCIRAAFATATSADIDRSTSNRRSPGVSHGYLPTIACTRAPML